jgi:hypothetical protein
MSKPTTLEIHSLNQPLPVVKSTSRRTPIITIVALIALGAIAVGILAILPQTKDLLAPLGLPGGITFLVVGTIALVVLFAVEYIRRSKEEESHSPSHPSTPSSPSSKSSSDTDESSSSSEETSIQKAKPTLSTSEKKQSPQTPSQQFPAKTSVDAAKPTPLPEKKVTSIPSEQKLKPQPTQQELEEKKRRLKEIYGNEMPPIPIRNGWGKTGDAHLEKQEKLISAYDREILELKLATISDFSVEEWDILLLRLARIERQETLPQLPTKPWEERITNPTLAELRELQCSEQMMDSLTSSIIGLCLLSSHQLEMLFSSAQTISREQLYVLLPFNTPQERDYTSDKLAKLSKKSITPLIPVLKPEQLHLLPIDYFREDLIPMENFTREETIKRLLPTKSAFIEKTTKILQAYSNDAIIQRAPFLSAKHISCFKADQLKDPEFPWDDFLKKEKIGSGLFEGLFGNLSINMQWSPEEFASFSIPWATFAKYPAEVIYLLDTGFDYKAKTQAILRKLKIEDIVGVAPALAAEHILCFEDRQLNDPKFPWLEFFKKKEIEWSMDRLNSEILIQQLKGNDVPWDNWIQRPRIGEAMHRWKPLVLAESPIPWAKLALKKNEINELFDEADKNVTRLILQALNYPALQVIAPVLSIDHIRMFTVAQLQNSEFPWEPFVKKEKISHQLFSGIDGKQWSSVEFASFSIPWTSFAEYPKEVTYLLDLDSSYKAKTTAILRGLKIEDIVGVAPALKAEHILCFEEKQLNDPKFPWLEFFKKEGIESCMDRLNSEILIQQLKGNDVPWDNWIQRPRIGEAMHRWKPLVLAESPIPWAKLALKKNAINELFDEGDKNVTQPILQALNYPALQVIAPALSIDHIRMFTVAQLQNPEFPWEPFVKKENISHQLFNGINYKQWSPEEFASFSIPWAIFAKRLEEVNYVLDLTSNDKAKTTAILRGLKIEDIVGVAPALKAEHILCFEEKQLNDPKFPWLEFFKKEGIESFMDRLNPEILIKQLKRDEFPWDDWVERPSIGRAMHDWKPKVLAESPIPWAKLVVKTNEINLLFDKDDNDVTRPILQALDFPALIEIAPALVSNHIQHFKATQLQNPQFPWDLFVEKWNFVTQLFWGIGRAWSAREFASFPIPWARFTAKEVNYLLDLDYKVQTRGILENLDFEVIKILAPSLKLEHIPLCNEEHQKYPDFPRNAFQ